MIRVRMMTRYSSLGASSRYRTYQYLPHLEESGLDVHISPLFDDTYLRRVYAGEPKSPTRAAAAYARRLSELLTGRPDVLYLEKELLPMLPYALERHLLRAPAVVVDLDDAVFHNYDLAGSRLGRAVLGDKIDRIMGRATLTIAGNPYIASRATAAGCDWVEVVPSVVDLRHYPWPPDASAASAPPDDASFTVGWIGTPVTAGYLDIVKDALAGLATEGPVRLLVIGALGPSIPRVAVETRAWSFQTEVADLCRCDVGIMPLADSPFERGKCGLKLIQYMACGRPVVASPVGVNSEIVRQGENGLLATTPEDWLSALRILRDDGALRQKLGEAGRRKVETTYSLEVTGPRLAALIAEAARRGGTP